MENSRKLCAVARPSERALLLVRELGSPALVGAGDGIDETVVIAQAPGESPAAFAERVAARLASAEQSNRCFGSALLQAGWRHDEAIEGARRQIGLALSRHAIAHGNAPKVTLEAPATASQHARASLFGLLEELVSSSRGKALPVRLFFESDPLRAPRTSVAWGAP